MLFKFTFRLESPTVVRIPLKQIRVFKNQPRRSFNADYINDLGQSLKEVQTDALLVRRLTPPEGDVLFELIRGENRYRAATQANLGTLDALIACVEDEKEQFIIALMDSIQKEDLDPLDRAHAIQKLKEWGMLEREIAKVFHKSPSWVSEQLRVLKLSPEVVAKIRSSRSSSKNGMSASTARQLSRLPIAVQQKIARTTGNKERLSTDRVRQLADAASRKCNVSIPPRVTRRVEGFRKFQLYLQELPKNLQALAGRRDLDAILEGGKPADREQLVERLEQSLTSITALKKRIEAFITATKK
jgi:ParB/RepB/Spo0J family partition protein